MPLQPQNVTVSLAEGVDTKTDPKKVMQGKLVTLQNGYFQTPQEIRKRNGYAALSTSTQQGSTISKGVMLAAYNSELVMGDGTSLYSYDSGQGIWNTMGAFIPSLITTNPVTVTNSANQSYQDGVYDSASGLQCFIYLAANNYFYSIIDQTTGQKIVSGQIIAATSPVFMKVLFFAGKFVFLYYNSSGTNLQYITVSTSSPLAQSAATTLATDINTTNPNFDATVISTQLFVAWNSNVTGITTCYLSNVFVKSAELTKTTHAATGCIAIWGDASNNAWIAHSDNTAVYGIVFNFTLNSTPVLAYQTLSFTANVNQVSGAAVATKSYIVTCSRTQGIINNLTSLITLTLAGAGVQAWNQRSVSIASKVFVYGSNAFALLHYGGATTDQPTLFLYQLGSVPNLVGKLAADVAFDNTRVQALPEVTLSTTGTFMVAYAQGIGQNEVPIFSCSYAAFINLAATPQTAQIANTLHMTGGQLWMYDGVNVVEHSFHLYPTLGTPTPSGSGAVLNGSSLYSYIAVYEWVDAQGQLHRSNTSLPVNFTTAATGPSTVSVTCSTLRVSQKGNTVNVYLYRTAGNGTIYYYCAGPVANNQANDTITFTDNASDATITARTQLYITSGEVENSSAPPCKALTVYKSRLIVVPSDNPYSWWFSKQVLPTSAATVATPVEFSQFFIQNIDQTGGPLVGVAVMDGSLILSKSSTFFYVYGDGPAVNGTGNDFISPQATTSDVGFQPPTPAALLPDGLIFQSAKGINILSRNLSTNYIGAEIEGVLGNSNVTSAILVPTYNHVRLGLSSGVAIVYDYLINQWFVYTNHAVVQACLFQTQYTYLQANGVVMQETPSVFLDGTSFIQLSLTTGWLSFSGIQEFQRLYEMLILGDYASAHSLVVGIAYDFNSTITQTDTIPATTAPSGAYQWRIFFKQQKCEAVQITLSDSQTPAYGEGCRLSALTFKVGKKAGTNKIPASRSFG